MTTTRVNLQIDVNGREASASVVRVQRAFDKLNKEVSENGRAPLIASVAPHPIEKEQKNRKFADNEFMRVFTGLFEAGACLRRVVGGDGALGK